MKIWVKLLSPFRSIEQMKIRKVIRAKIRSFIALVITWQFIPYNSDFSVDGERACIV